MRFWLVLSGLLVFAAGAAVGFLADRTLVPGERCEPIPVAETLLDVPPYVITGGDVYGELELDERQQAEIDALLENHYRRVSDLRASLQALSIQLQDALLAALRPEQRDNFQKIQRKYGERAIQGGVGRELMSLRVELALTPEQEPRAYQILYDSARERRESFRSSRPGSDRNALRSAMAEIATRRDGRMAEILSPEQLAKYREVRDRERKQWTDRHDRKKKRDDPPRPPPGGGPSPAEDPGTAP